MNESKKNAELIREIVERVLSEVGSEIHEEDKRIVRQVFSNSRTFAATLCIFEFLLARHDELALNVAQSVMNIRKFDDEQRKEVAEETKH